MADTTAIRISKDTWHRLNDLKDSPGMTFDDVVGDLLDEYDHSIDDTEAVADGGDS